MMDIKTHGKTMKDIDLIIFDKDGTLFEMYPYWSAIARNRAVRICHALDLDDERIVCQIMESMGVDITHRTMLPDGPIGVQSRDYVEICVVDALKSTGHKVTINIVDAAFQETDTYMFAREGLLPTALVPVPGLVQFLEASDSWNAILSYDQTKNLHRIMRLSGLYQHFGFLLGGDLLEQPKPHPAGAITIMDYFGISPKNTLLIGDSIQDISCGKNAGCAYTIARESEITDRESMRDLADFIIADYTEMEVV